MAVSFIQRVATALTVGGRLTTKPNAVPFVYDDSTSQFKYVDKDGVTIRSLGGTALPLINTAAALTLTAAMAGRTITDTLGSGTSTFTLPSAVSNPGIQFTFINGDAAGEILINPTAAEQISIKGLVDHSTSVKPVAGTGVKNTAATNVLGDHITLRSNGVCWNEVAGAGIWATQ